MSESQLALTLALNEWILTSKIQDYLISNINPFESFNTNSLNSSKQKYEIGNVLEHWLISMVNVSPFSTKESKDSKSGERAHAHAQAHSGIYKILPISNPIHQKVIAELSRKLHWSTSSATTIVENILKIIENHLLTYDYCQDAHRKSFKFEVTPRISCLLSGTPSAPSASSDVESVQLMMVKYQTILSDFGGGGQQWGLTQKHFNFLYEYGVRLECFASPLNFRLLGKSGAYFCSIFPDSDAKFGSLGNFFDVKDETIIDFLSAHARDGDGSHIAHMQVNPPFVETILSDAAKKCLSILNLAYQKGKNLKIFFHTPAWYDAEFYTILTNKQFDKMDVDIVEMKLKRGMFKIEKPNGEIIQSSVDNLYFCLSSMAMSRKEKNEIEKLLMSSQ